MALFAIFCLDRPDRAPVRKAKLGEHRAHFQKAGGAVRAAGPMTADTGDTQCGSLIVYEAETIDGARAFIDADPYTRAGLFEQITVRQWQWMSGADKPEN
jgi:uncharacterized protein YciI